MNSQTDSDLLAMFMLAERSRCPAMTWEEAARDALVALRQHRACLEDWEKERGPPQFKQQEFLPPSSPGGGMVYGPPQRNPFYVRPPSATEAKREQEEEARHEAFQKDIESMAREVAAWGAVRSFLDRQYDRKRLMERLRGSHYWELADTLEQAYAVADGQVSIPTEDQKS